MATTKLTDKTKMNVIYLDELKTGDCFSLVDVPDSFYLCSLSGQYLDLESFQVLDDDDFDPDNNGDVRVVVHNLEMIVS